MLPQNSRGRGTGNGTNGWCRRTLVDPVGIDRPWKLIGSMICGQKENPVVRDHEAYGQILGSKAPEWLVLRNHILSQNVLEKLRKKCFFQSMTFTTVAVVESVQGKQTRPHDKSCNTSYNHRYESKPKNSTWKRTLKTSKTLRPKRSRNRPIQLWNFLKKNPESPLSIGKLRLTRWKTSDVFHQITH